MYHLVLGIGYSRQDYEIEKSEWRKYGITFEFVDSVQQAAERLNFSEYVCITICSEHISYSELELLRQSNPIPILVLPPTYTVAQRLQLAHFSAMQYLRAARQYDIIQTEMGSVQQYLNLSDNQREPLTIITVKDLCFCLEYRSVEVRGQEIELTAKEFDILALLIMNQRRVFTYEMLYEQVWSEPSDYFTKKTLITHISTLRKKLRIAEDVPDYIKSVHGMGYKFDAAP